MTTPFNVAQRYAILLVAERSRTESRQLHHHHHHHRRPARQQVSGVRRITRYLAGSCGSLAGGITAARRQTAAMTSYASGNHGYYGNHGVNGFFPDEVKRITARVLDGKTRAERDRRNPGAPESEVNYLYEL